MSENEVILDLLRRVARRIQVDRALHHAGFGAGVVGFTLLAFQLTQLQSVGVIAGKVASAVVACGIFVFCGYVLSRAVRQVSLVRAAGLADSRARLRDELKSAHWFLANDKSTPFVDAHVSRAAQRASQLDAVSLVPISTPCSVLLAGAPFLLLAVTLWAKPYLADAWALSASAGAVSADAGRESLRTLLEEMPAQADEVAKLEEALSTLERTDASREALQQAAAQARDAVDQVNMRATVAREGLEKLAGAMKDRPEFAQVARALEQGRTDEAVRMLERLRNEMSTQHGDPASAQDAAPQEPGGDARHALEQTSRDLSGISAKVNEDTVNRVLKNIEAARDSMEVQRRVNNAKRRMDDFMVATSQRSALAANQFGNRMPPPNPTSAPETGNLEMQGGTMYRQGAVLRGEQEKDSNDGSETGASSGHSASLAVEGTATQRLDARLKLETLRTDEDDESKDKGPDSDWFYSASQQQASESGFASVRERDSYARADVMRPGYVPMSQRQAVRNYFINLHEGGKK